LFKDVRYGFRAITRGDELKAKNIGAFA